jgi:plasmid replication initiation protein
MEAKIMSLTLIKKEYLVEKRNVFNEMRSNNMTLQGLRFLSVYLSKINARDPKTRVVRFSMKSFLQIIEFKGNFKRSYYEETINRLLGYVIHMPTERGLDSFQLFKKCRLEQGIDGEWYVEIDAHDDALPLMFEFKDRYFSYELWNALRLSSFNQVRMYEILKQHEYKGEVSISLADLRNLLNISSDEHQRWERFKTHVLEKCRTVLAEKTDIKYTYEPIRNGRGGKVTGLKFFIEKNKDYVDQLCLLEYLDNDCIPETAINTPMSDEIKERSLKKSAEEKKQALDEAKKSDFWYYAYEKAKKATHIKVTPEQYARGIVQNWQAAGYETVRDLVESGEISQKDIDKKPSFDLDEFIAQEQQQQAKRIREAKEK